MNPSTMLDVYISTGPPADDLAREAWLLETAADGKVSLLLTSWRGPVVVLGYAQNPEEADLEWCHTSGIPVLRRLTGGTGVIHRYDVGVGLFLPYDHPWAKGVIGLYDRFLDVLEPALHRMGSKVTRLVEPGHASRVRSPVCFLDQLSDTLAVEGRKSVGCAQTRRRGAVLIHAAILLGLAPQLYQQVFDVPAEEIAERLAPAVQGVGWRQVGDAIIERVAGTLGLDVRRCAVEPVPEKYLKPYRTRRWSPVP